MSTRLQATVREWSPDGGTAFLDDGTVVEIPAEALRQGPFRLLRLGQRVALVMVEGSVAAVELL